MDETMVFVQSFVAVGWGVLPVRFGVFLPQPSTHPILHEPLHFIKHSRAVAVVEVADPSPHLSVDSGEDFFGFLPMSVPGGCFSDGFLEFCATLGTRFHMGIVSPALGHPPLQQEAKELEAFPLEVHDSGLLFVELQSPAF